MRYLIVCGHVLNMVAVYEDVDTHILEWTTTFDIRL